MMSGAGLRRIIEECQRCTERLIQEELVAGKKSGMSDFVRDFVDNVHTTNGGSFIVDDIYEAAQKAGKTSATRNAIGTALARLVDKGELWVERSTATSGRGRPVNRYGITGTQT
jgi:hypothetical protein